MKFPILNEAVLLGLLITILWAVLFSSKSDNRFFKQLYTYVPTLFLLLFVPALLNSTGIIAGNESALPKVASQVLLPAALILLSLSADIKGIFGLGKKALLSFFGVTVAIVVAAPIAYLLACWTIPNFKEDAATHEYWKGIVTICGSWVGGSSSQSALRQVYGTGAELFAVCLLVDAIVQSVWTALLIYGIGFKEKVDKWLGVADNQSIEELKKRISNFKGQKDRPAELTDLVKILAVGFGFAGLAHLIANALGFLGNTYLWLIIICTTIGIALSFNLKIRALDKLGASDISQIFIYFVILTIGIQIDLSKFSGNFSLYLFAFVWLLIQGILSFLFARLIKANYFFYATGSQANFGGVATAGALASMFHPSLSVVGALLGVLSTIIGVYCGMACAWLLQFVI